MLLVRHCLSVQWQATWIARLAVATQLQLLAPLQDVLALGQRLDVVEPADRSQDSEPEQTAMQSYDK